MTTQDQKDFQELIQLEQQYGVSAENRDVSIKKADEQWARNRGLVPKTGNWERPEKWIKPKEQKQVNESQDVEEIVTSESIIKSMVSSLEKQLTKEEIEHRNLYTGSGMSFEINRYLRTGITYRVDSSFCKERINKVDKVFKVRLPKTVRMWRGITLETREKAKEVFKKGSIFQDNGYISTTSSHAALQFWTGGDKDRGIVLSITIPKNTEVLPHSEEQELVLKRGTKFIVKDVYVSKHSKELNVELEVINGESNE